MGRGAKATPSGYDGSMLLQPYRRLQAFRACVLGHEQGNFVVLSQAPLQSASLLFIATRKTTLQ